VTNNENFHSFAVLMVTVDTVGWATGRASIRLVKSWVLVSGPD